MVEEQSRKSWKAWSAMSCSSLRMDDTSKIWRYARRWSTETSGPPDASDTEEEDEEEEEESRARSSSARCPAKEVAERAKRGQSSREKVEKAVTNPVGWKGSSSSSLPSTAAEGGGKGRSGVTRGKELSKARRGKSWWV